MSDPLLAAPLRAGLRAFPSSQGEADFSTLAVVLGAANNTLSANLQRLEAAGYVELRRGFLGRKPRTRVVLTAAGCTAWAAHLERLG